MRKHIPVYKSGFDCSVSSLFTSDDNIAVYSTKFQFDHRLNNNISHDLITIRWDDSQPEIKYTIFQCQTAFFIKRFVGRISYWSTKWKILSNIKFGQHCHQWLDVSKYDMHKLALITWFHKSILPIIPNTPKIQHILWLQVPDSLIKMSKSYHNLFNLQNEKKMSRRCSLS